mmetsp:Transcript_43370/g.41800  ORF Transcript_43370/g.41800 Transcript_43370/m.41800 type:complete len:114 (+) Transcript_43370:599-940(+)
MNAKDLFDKLRQDLKLKKYLHIIEKSPRYTVFYDQNGNVLSLPPIINSDHTKVTLDTKNIFFDITGTDLHKMKICMTALTCLFSQHCQGDDKFCVEQVDIIYEGKEHLNETTP